MKEQHSAAVVVRWFLEHPNPNSVCFDKTRSMHDPYTQLIGDSLRSTSGASVINLEQQKTDLVILSSISRDSGFTHCNSNQATGLWHRDRVFLGTCLGLQRSSKAIG